MRSLLAVGVALSIAASANAALMGNVIMEMEPNDTDATAQDIGSIDGPVGSGDVALIDGEITSGDVDWYVFDVVGVIDLAASVFQTPFDMPTTADSQLMLLDSGLNIVAFDDDDNVGDMSAFATRISTGRYYLGVSSFNDAGNPDKTIADPDLSTLSVFDGVDNDTMMDHTGDFTYKLGIFVNIVPEPTSVALVLIGAVFTALRRR